MFICEKCYDKSMIQFTRWARVSPPIMLLKEYILKIVYFSNVQILMNLICQFVCVLIQPHLRLFHSIWLFDYCFLFFQLFSFVSVIWMNQMQMTSVDVLSLFKILMIHMANRNQFYCLFTKINNRKIDWNFLTGNMTNLTKSITIIIWRTCSIQVLNIETIWCLLRRIDFENDNETTTAKNPLDYRFRWVTNTNRKTGTALWLATPTTLSHL